VEAEGCSKCWYPSTKLYGVTSQKTDCNVDQSPHYVHSYLSEQGSGKKHWLCGRNKGLHVCAGDCRHASSKWTHHHSTSTRNWAATVDSSSIRRRREHRHVDAGNFFLGGGGGEQINETDFLPSEPSWWGRLFCLLVYHKTFVCAFRFHVPPPLTDGHKEH
jgi:hypothetical protein